MKGIMKTMFSAILVSASLFGLAASGQQEAISSFTPNGPVGYATNGAGFAFTPLVPIAVTALGFDGQDLPEQPYVVGLFDATGLQLAGTLVTASGTFYNQTYYQNISPVDLTVGQTYYLGAIGLTNGNFWVGVASYTFSANPDISYLGYATDFMPPATFPPEPIATDAYLVGANLEFTVVPEPSFSGAAGMALLGLTCLRRRREALA
jgi:hypothetical protein